MKISLDMTCLIFIFGMIMMIFVDDPLAIVMTANAVSENGYELTSSNTILHESFFNEDGPVKGNVVFDSDIGSEYLFESIKDSGSSTALRLINSMIEQPDLKYCAPTSVVCVFNAMKYHPNNIPPPPEYYYNENVAIKYWKVEAFIRHECVSKSVSYSGRTFGFSMDELIKIISCFLQGSDYDVKGYHAKEFKSLKDFETALSREVNKPGNYVIANICHALINESGGGHFSPIGAYHKGSSRFLFLDTARYKYPFVWVKTQDLFNSMNTIDPAENATRGYIVISKRANEKTLLRIETD